MQLVIFQLSINVLQWKINPSFLNILVRRSRNLSIGKLFLASWAVSNKIGPVDYCHFKLMQFYCSQRPTWNWSLSRRATPSEFSMIGNGVGTSPRTWNPLVILLEQLQSGNENSKASEEACNVCYMQWMRHFRTLFLSSISKIWKLDGSLRIFREDDTRNLAIGYSSFLLLGREAELRTPNNHSISWSLFRDLMKENVLQIN